MGGFLSWLDDAWWTPHGIVFDIGNATREALLQFRKSSDHTTCGGRDEYSNGNGSLMRCMPISCWLFGQKTTEQIQLAGDASALTHAHIRSQLCCTWHALWCDGILSERDVRTAARDASDRLRRYVPEFERLILARLLDGSVMDLPRASVISDGYVVATTEASLWCIANHADFPSAVLAAVNLGGDTDTTGAVAGGMAGLHYGLNAIPTEWVAALVRRDDVMALAERFATACVDHWQKT
jgi:ADP-ribosyl-[dinitrogen reductase] hydrolase